MQYQPLQFQRGFSLIEVLVYVAILVVASALVVSVLLSLARGYAEVRAAQVMQRSALATVERITREIRLSDTVNTSASVLGTHPGRIVLERTDSGVTDSVEIYADSGIVRILENGVDGGVLTTQDVTASSLIFRSLDNGSSRGVRVELELEAAAGGMVKRESFYSFAATRKPSP